MRTLNEHIKTGKFKQVYLLYEPKFYLEEASTGISLKMPLSVTIQ